MASQVSQPGNGDAQPRPVYNFPPEIWSHRLDSMIPSNQKHHKLEWYEKEVEMLKSMAEAILMDTTNNAAERIKLIDLFCRLGISYHFHAEILRQLRQIFDSQVDLLYTKDYDLYTVAVVFRVFRQHGMKMSSDVFSKFKCTENGKFEESYAGDTKGLLSLFEASHLSTDGEHTLEEAQTFSRTHLELIISQSKSDLNDEITRSLTTPLHKGPPQIKAREFILFYEKCPQYYEPQNDTLLKFAKLDFNRVQLLHQQEIKNIYKWWKEQDLKSKLPFARDIVMESFFWSDCIYFEPKYARARAEYTKQINLLGFLDDVYDTYGAFDELPIFTDTMQRWDRGMMDQLPKDYMKHLFKAYLDVFYELENHASRDGTSMGVALTREYVQEFARAYLQEAEWMKNGYLPSFKESLELGIITGGKRYMQAVAFVGMGEELTVQACKWLQNGPMLAEAVGINGRLANELMSHKHDEETGNFTKPFSCYKREYKVSEEETMTEFRRRITNAWKTINEELMREFVNIPLEILIRVVNYGRIMEVFYKDGDGLTDGKYVESLIKTLYFDPIPL